MGLCLAVSDVDAVAFREGGARRVELCPNGADALERLPRPRGQASDPLRVLFRGNRELPAYERGVSWFVREVIPGVQEHVPMTFRVVGSPPVRPFAAPHVDYVGARRRSLPTYYEEADVPVFQGSGTRLKVLEAMAYGRPVVPTPLGAEGLPVQALRSTSTPPTRGFARPSGRASSSSSSRLPREAAALEPGRRGHRRDGQPLAPQGP